MTMQDKTVKVRLTGRVQGVWFRGWTAERARHLDLGGWVRNRNDGSLEAFFCGAGDAVDEMLAQMKLGPSAARIDDMEVEDVKEMENAAPCSDRVFEVRPTC